MQARNVTRGQMFNALQAINKKYGGNVEFNRFDGARVFNFTLKVKDSRGKGAKLGFSRRLDGRRRRTSNACWHVHGDFFDALLEINPAAVIVTAFARIDANGGNWQDKQVGSMVEPVMYSQMCECDYR